MLTGLTDLSYNVKTFYIKPEVSFTIVLSPGHARFIDFYFPGEGPVICNDRVKTVVVDHPVEECALEPVKSCHQVTVPHGPQPTARHQHGCSLQVKKLGPKLVPVQECVDVPKEICARSKTNPHKVKRPVIKKWCYVPSQESGLV